MIIFHGKDIHFCLDHRTGQLWRGDAGQEPLHLPRKEWEVLRYLAERPGILISTGELQEAIWGSEYVGETSVSQAISKVRRVIGDQPRQSSVIETVQGRGYRFIADIEGHTDPSGKQVIDNVNPVEDSVKADSRTPRSEDVDGDDLWSVLEGVVAESGDSARSLAELVEWSDGTFFWYDCEEEWYIPFGDSVVKGSTIVHYDLNFSFGGIYQFAENNLLPEETASRLRDALRRRTSVSVHAVALFALCAWRDQASLADVIACTTDKRSIIREISVWGLSRFPLNGSDELKVHEALLKEIHDAAGDVRHKALEGLRKTKYAEIVSVASHLLVDRCSKVIDLSLKILGEHRSNEAFDVLALYPPRATSDYHLEWWTEAVVKHEHPDVEQLLIELLNTPRFAHAFDDNYIDKSAFGERIVTRALRALSRRPSERSVACVERFVRIDRMVELSDGRQRAKLNVAALSLGILDRLAHP